MKNFIQNNIKSILVSQLSNRSDDQKQLIYDSLIESNSPLANLLLSEKKSSKDSPGSGQIMSGLLKWRADAAKNIQKLNVAKSKAQNSNRKLYLGLMNTGPSRDIFLKFLKSKMSPGDFLKSLKSKNDRNLFMDQLGSMVEGINPGVAVGGGLAAAGAMKGQQRQMEHQHDMMKMENEMASTMFYTQIDDDGVYWLHKAQTNLGCLVERLRNIKRTFEGSLQIRVDEFYEQGGLHRM